MSIYKYPIQHCAAAELHTTIGVSYAAEVCNTFMLTPHVLLHFSEMFIPSPSSYPAKSKTSGRMLVYIYFGFHWPLCLQFIVHFLSPVENLQSPEMKDNQPCSLRYVPARRGREDGSKRRCCSPSGHSCPNTQQ